MINGMSDGGRNNNDFFFFYLLLLNMCCTVLTFIYIYKLSVKAKETSQ